MTITLNNVWKSYENEWVLRNVNYDFQAQKSYAILGPNGSGKSTLLQLLAGNVSPSKGEITYSKATDKIPVEEIYRYIGFSSPYMELPEDLTLLEMVKFHGGFRKFLDNRKPMDIVAAMNLERDANKQVKNFSSGMKQRVKLGLSVLTESDMLLLDEPVTNLDDRGIAWYQELIKEYRHDRLLIVSSNRLEEYEMCEARVDVLTFK